MKNVTYINAGAGSGKTFTLTQELVHLIKQGKAIPEQVILTTFTIKAACEFKEKAKAELYKNGFFDEAVRLDHALIGTVHSVCQKMISKYWFLLGLTPDMGVMVDEDAAYYMSQSLAELPTDEELRQLHSFAYSFDIRQKMDGRVSHLIDNEFWRADLQRIIELTVNYEVADYKKSEEESLKYIAQFVDKSIRLSYTPSQLKKILDEHQDFLDKQRPSDKNDKRLDTLRELYRSYQRPTVAWYAKAGELMTELKSCGPLVEAFREHAAKVWNSVLVFEEQKKYIHLIFELALRWRDNYARFKQEKNLLDFNDMEKYMHQLLARQDVAREIANTYHFLFVDEFQDSSPIQVKIFDALSDLMQASYWVGDYKQAIYGFRGSDIKLVKAVVDRISQKQDGCDTRTLDTSWRSLPDIVDIDNKIFCKTFEGILNREHIELKKHRMVEEVAEDGNLLPGKVKSLRYFRTTDQLDVSAHIYKLIREEQVKPSDIGVLARTNGELAHVASRLRVEYGVSSSRDNISVVETGTYELVESLLYILNSSKDHLAKAKVAWYVEKDMSVRELIERKILNDERVLEQKGAKDEDYLLNVPIIRHLLRIKAKLQQQSIASLVESMVIELNLFDVVKSISTDGNAGASYLQVILNAARAYEDHSVQMNQPATIDGFIDYIRMVNPTGSGDAEGVQLHTYHSCKGLEQRYVILMSLNNDEGDTAKLIRNEIYGVHAVHDSEPTIDNLYPEVYVRMLLWVYGTKKNVPSLISEHIVATEGYCHVRQAALAEANRLLYVGMTRPRDVMLLEIKPAKRGKKPLQWFEAVGYTSITPQPEQGAWDIFGTGNKFADFTVTPEERDRMAEGGMLKDGPSYRLIRTSSTGLPEEETESSVFSPRYLSPSQISYKGNVASATDFGARIAFISRPSDMAEVGDCIHQIFSYIEESKRNVVKTIQQYGLDNVLSGADEIVESWNRLTTFLTHAHGAALRTYHERPFRLERDGQTIVGSIDLVWKTLDGCILVDYKTCPMGAKAVLDAGSEHYAGWYAGQLDAYTEALELAGEKVLKRYIYYPVAGIVAEVERTFKTEIK